MALITLNFNFPINVSAQIGDIVYVVSPSLATGATTPAANLQEAGITNSNVLGIIRDISERSMTVSTTWTDAYGVSFSGNYSSFSGTEFIMFSKHKESNTSGLIGYYMEAEFVNNSTEEAELFSIGSNITINS
jgi:hypothetical protein